MAIAHPGHENIYTADSYATRSTSLKDNYFIRNGKADEWAAGMSNEFRNSADDNAVLDAADAGREGLIVGIDREALIANVKVLINASGRQATPGPTSPPLPTSP